jgi:4-hydroxy-tetrahydrodipicolinate synthase
MSGVLAPVVTPFDAALDPDADRLIAHSRALLAHDCGLAVFGTNSEGNSLSVGEKIDLIDRMIDAGLPPERMMPGTGACALPDAVALCAHVARTGCGGGLILPPFYYRAATDEGLFAFFSEVIQRVGDPRLRLYLYHIPPVAGIGVSLDLYERLINAYPGVVVGTKDSSQDDAHTQLLIERFPGFAVFPGNEMNLAAFVRAGAAGTISATCNVNAAAIVDLYRKAGAPDADARQAAVNSVRATLARFPMIAAMKSVLAEAYDDAGWRALRPPLSPLGTDEARALAADLERIGFRLDMAAPAPGGAL